MADGEHSVRLQRMSMQAVVGEPLAAGFVLDRLVEPRVTEAYRAIDPDRYDRLLDVPTLLALRLRRP